MSGRIRRRGPWQAVYATAAASAVLATGLAAASGGTAPALPGRTAPMAAVQAAETARAVAEGLPSESQAQAAAAKAGKRVEVTGLRGESREVFANPDGSFSAREYTQPVRTVRAGRWVPVDDTLVQRPDGALTPRAATVDLSFSGGGTGPFARMNRAGREIALSWPGGALPKPEVSADSATYREVLPGVDLVVRAEVDGFGHLLVVKTRQAADNPELSRIELGLRTRNLTVTRTPAGALRAVDAAVGGTVFEAGGPMMWDSAGTAGSAAPSAQPKKPSAAAAPQGRADSATAPSGRASLTPPPAATMAPVKLEVGRGRLSLVPDQAMLRDPDTVFPVVIDPIDRTTSRTAWTSVMSGMPSEQDWKFSDSAGMGRCPTDYNPVSCNGVGVRRLLYTLPLSYYKGKQILHASFSTRVAHIYQATPTAEPVQLYRIGGKNYGLTSSSSWSSTSGDWDSHLMTVSKAISPVSCSSNANLHFEGGALTTEVAAAASGGWDQMTLGLRAEDETTFAQWKRMCGNAYLTVSYNNPPLQIKTTDMLTGSGGLCTWGSGRPYLDVLPKLRAEARDPDHTAEHADKVKVYYRVQWTDSGGTAHTFEANNGSWLAPVDGTYFDYQLKNPLPDGQRIPENTVVYWTARAYDGDAYGPWSYEGSAQSCEFIYDSTKPGAPVVVSPQYQSEIWNDGVGVSGTFTFSPNTKDSIPDGDVVSYLYSFNGATSTSVPATAAGGPSQPVQRTPTKSGRSWVTVMAVDRAGKTSAPATYSFNVKAGRGTVGQWNLGDPDGSTEAVDEVADDRSPATGGSGVAFGATGPGSDDAVAAGLDSRIDRAVSLDGSANAYLATDSMVTDTGHGFSVSAWVKPDAADRDMVAVSQDGVGEPGFTLGYNADAGNWAFRVPVADVDSLGVWAAAASGTATCRDQTTAAVCPGEWVHLAGVYDESAGKLQLYVNGVLKATADRRSVWSARGPLQIGRVVAKTGYTANWAGDLAEVRVYDRVTPQAEIQQQLTVKPVRKAYWPLDTASSGSSPEAAGGQPMTIGGDAVLWTQTSDEVLFGPWPLVADQAPDGTTVAGGDLQLGGAGWASTASPPVSGTGSFTVAGRVRLTTPDAAQSQAVLSLAGAHTNRFAVYYRPPVADPDPAKAEPARWELVVPDEDTAASAVDSVVDREAGTDNSAVGQHLAVVYDAVAKDLRLYVDGQLADTARLRDHATSWAASGGLQLGRAMTSSGWADYLAGEMDDVRVYSGAADLTAVQQMAALIAQPGL